jgi:hypothetical protein
MSSFYNLFIVIITNADYAIDRNMSSPFEEILFLLPFVSLMSSPSKYVKALATELLLLLEKFLVKMLMAPKHKSIIEEGNHYLSTPGIIVLRLLRHLWYQVFHLAYKKYFLFKMLFRLSPQMIFISVLDGSISMLLS